MGTLVISEKNISARRIATILSKGNYRQETINNVSVYHFNTNGDWYIIGLRGHIMKLDYPSKYDRWNIIPPRELLKIDPIRTVGEKAIAGTLQKLGEKNDSVIIATDYDREGELIGVESLDAIKTQINIKRAHFSSLTNNEIITSFQNLKPIDYNLAKSAQTRQMIDLMWGACLTRFISLSSGQLGKDFLSVGRVQTPTLALIVDREKQIKNFIPVPFWNIEVHVQHKNKKFKVLKGKIKQENSALQLYKKIKDAKTAEITHVQENITEEYPPPPFNTTSFLEAASRLDFSASEAMEIAEILYMRGVISYPRTDNTIYPPNLPIQTILNKLKATEFSPEVDKVLSDGRQSPMKGKKKATDHPPIHPVESLPKNKVDMKQWKIYELITRRFLATLAKNSKIKTMELELNIAGETFKKTGRQILEMHWREIYPYIRSKEEILPSLKKGDILTINKIKNTKSETKPPKRYTQGALITEMEKKHLGTKSTRHEIIKKLYWRKYVKGKTLIPTLSAIAVTEALEKNAGAITSADMTANLEDNMDKIAEGKKDFQTVFQESQTILDTVMKTLEGKKNEIGESIRKALAQENDMGKNIGKCPECGGPMMVMKAKKRFLGCTNFPKCTNSYPLPQKGAIAFEDKYCDTCKSPIVKIITKTKWETCVNMNCPSRRQKN